MTLSGVEGALNILALLSTAPHKLGGPGLGQNARCWIKWIGGGKRLQFCGLLAGGSGVFQRAGAGDSWISYSRGQGFCTRYKNLFSGSSVWARVFLGLFL